MVQEEHAGYLAALSRTADDIAAVRELLESMEEPGQADAGAFARWSLTNYRFHNRLIESSRRPRLCRIALSLRDSVEGYVRLEAAMTGQVHDAASEHWQMFEAFRAGDAHGLARLSREHVAGTASRLLDGLRSASRQDRPDRIGDAASPDRPASAGFVPRSLASDGRRLDAGVPADAPAGAAAPAAGRVTRPANQAGNPRVT
jgi:hypothetical protein